MKYYAGLDVSMKETFICIMREDGNTMYEGKAYREHKKVWGIINHTTLFLFNSF